MNDERIDRAWTKMGASETCPGCGRQTHTKGMIGGGWRVDGRGGPELVLEIQTRPGAGGLVNARTRIVVDREGRVVEAATR